MVMNHQTRQTVIEEVRRANNGALVFTVLVRRAFGIHDDQESFSLIPDNLPAIPNELPEYYSDTLVVVVGDPKGNGVAFDVAVYPEGYGENDHQIHGPYRVKVEEIPVVFGKTGRKQVMPLVSPS
jgi:hypothetical protein